MRTPVLVPRVVLLSATIFWQPIEAPDCCPIKTVTDALEEELNGVYTLKTKKDSKPDPKCIDDCVYMRDSEEYCFIEKPGATVVCEVSTLSSTTLVTHSFFHFVILRHFVFCCGNVYLFHTFQSLGSHLAILHWFQHASYVSCSRLW